MNMAGQSQSLDGEQNLQEITASDKNDAQPNPKVKASFKLFDKNGDGKITIDELESVMRQLGQEPTKLELKLLMKEADTDNSGGISLEEFVVYMTKPPRGRVSQSELKRQFDIFDKDLDGFITRAEMENCVKELELGSQFEKALVDQMFDEADLNSDGQISFEEYMKAMM